MIQRIKGTRDLLPPEVDSWAFLESMAREVFSRFGFKEIRPPLMEWTELFARGIGENTDVVEKEMYTFPDSQGRSISLRPEATAGVVRAYIENKLYAANPVSKLFTIGPMFRHERPQKGRFRQFHQINVEAVGDSGPAIDAEIIAMGLWFFERIGLRDFRLSLNSLGCPDCRPDFKKALLSFFETRESRLCEDCRRRLNKNPLRILDCKVPTCREVVQGAPATVDHLCSDCGAHFAKVREGMDRLGIDYELNPLLVRGLDYYTRTAFEVTTTRLGAQDAFMGGGRYDGLTALLDGPATPAIGFAIGMERLHLLVGDLAPETKPDLYVAALGEAGLDRAFALTHALRKAGMWVETGYEDKSLKSRMKQADRLGAKHVLILGSEEIEKGKAVLRNMRNKEQREVDLASLPESLLSLLGEE